MKVALLSLLAPVLGTVVTERTCSYKESTKEVTIDCESKEEKMKDNFKTGMKCEDAHATFSVEYKFANKTDTTKTKAAVKYDFRILELIEFTPTDITKGYQGEAAVSTYPSGGKWNWESIAYDSADGVYNFQATDGVVTLIGHYASKATNEVFDPNHVKFDVQVDNFPYASTGTALSISGRLQTDSKLKTKVDGEPTMVVDLEDEAVEGYFSVVESAKVNGADTKIVWSNKAGEESNAKTKNVFFTPETTDKIDTLAWDPEIGANYYSSATTMMVPLLLSVILYIL